MTACCASSVSRTRIDCAARRRRLCLPRVARSSVARFDIAQPRAPPPSPDNRGTTTWSTVPDLSSACHPPSHHAAALPTRISGDLLCTSSKFLTALAGACLLPLQPVFAHGFAGPHMFISTLLIDDPNVADEASLADLLLPAAAERWRRGARALRRSTSNSTSASPRTSASRLSDGYQWLHTPGAKTPAAGRTWSWA